MALKAELLELKTAVEEIKSNEKQHVPNQVGGSETDGRWTKVVKHTGRRNANATNGRQAHRTNRKSANNLQRSRDIRHH